MAEVRKGFTSLGFTKTFLLPALLVFLIPALTLWFFLHAQGKFDAEFREAMISKIQGDGELSPEQREKGLKFFQENRFSRLVRQAPFNEMVDGGARFQFATFRWMILLSAGSIAAGIGAFVIGGICVALSFISPRIQYWTLSLGWQVLKIYSALQTVAQGLMVFALSYWVTALWAERISPKLILGVGFIAGLGVVMVVVSIFKRIKIEFPVEGKVLDKNSSPELWKELNRICEKVGTAPPDQVILGIDDNFFVTENPMTVNGEKVTGRTLFLSLALLKHINGTEAEAILAHEMAHFSGQDTLYSKRITPLLIRFSHNLDALRAGVLTLPVFFFMNAFRAMFELSLSRMSRSREFRADRIAAETASPIGVAQGLLRTTAYSGFRNQVQNELFKGEEALKAANISDQIEEGFPAYAVAFGGKGDVKALENSHPFDSHPPLVQRLEALGIPCEREYIDEMLKTPGDGKWYDCIDEAWEMEREQWDELEERFREMHEQSLPYRFLPETEEELAVVVKAFPEVRIEGKESWFAVNHEGVQFNGWEVPVKFSEFTEVGVNDGVLTVTHKREGKKKNLSVKLKTFGKGEQQGIINAINHYYGRYQSAVAYQKQKKAAAGVIPE